MREEIDFEGKVTAPDDTQNLSHEFRRVSML